VMTLMRSIRQCFAHPANHERSGNLGLAVGRLRPNRHRVLGCRVLEGFGWMKANTPTTTNATASSQCSIRQPDDYTTPTPITMTNGMM